MTSPTGAADFRWMALEKPQFHDLDPERPQDHAEDQSASEPGILMSEEEQVEQVEQGHQALDISGHVTVGAEPLQSTDTSTAIGEEQNQSQPRTWGISVRAGVIRLIYIVSRLRGLVGKSSFRRRSR